VSIPGSFFASAEALIAQNPYPFSFMLRSINVRIGDKPPVPWDGTSQMPEKGGAALAAQNWVRKLALNFGMDMEAVAPGRRRFFRAAFGTDFRDCGRLDFRPSEPCPETYPVRDRQQRPLWLTRNAQFPVDRPNEQSRLSFQQRGA
jgi:hypothetical protein